MSYIHKDSKDCNTNSKLLKEFHQISQDDVRLHQGQVYQKFRRAIHRTKCFDDVKQVLVGLSGGVDSAVLLHLLFAYYQKENGPEVIALHVHHGQRGMESDRDQAVAREIALQVGCKFESVQLEDVEVGASESQLRERRYFTFNQVAKKYNCPRIVLGHHMDDQVETFLYRLVRGSDLQGLACMKIFRENLVRPLLECSRKEIEKLAEENEITYVHDSSNFSNAQARNYIRNIVLPMLSSKLDPQVSKHLFDLTESISDVVEYIAIQASEIIEKIRIEPHGYAVSKLQKIHPALRRKAIHQMYTHITKDKGSLSREQIEMIDRWMETPQSPKFLRLPSNIRVEKKQDVLRFSIIDE